MKRVGLVIIFLFIINNSQSYWQGNQLGNLIREFPSLTYFNAKAQSQATSQAHARAQAYTNAQNRAQIVYPNLNPQFYNQNYLPNPQNYQSNLVNYPTYRQNYQNYQVPSQYQYVNQNQGFYQQQSQFPTPVPIPSRPPQYQYPSSKQEFYQQQPQIPTPVPLPSMPQKYQYPPPNYQQPQIPTPVPLPSMPPQYQYPRPNQEFYQQQPQIPTPVPLPSMPPKYQYPPPNYQQHPQIPTPVPLPSMPPQYQYPRPNQEFYQQQPQISSSVPLKLNEQPNLWPQSPQQIPAIQANPAWINISPGLWALPTQNQESKLPCLVCSINQELLQSYIASLSSSNTDTSNYQLIFSPNSTISNKQTNEPTDNKQTSDNPFKTRYQIRNDDLSSKSLKVDTQTPLDVCKTTNSSPSLAVESLPAIASSDPSPFKPSDWGSAFLTSKARQRVSNLKRIKKIKYKKYWRNHDTESDSR